MIYKENPPWDSSPRTTFAILLQISVVSTGAKKDTKENMPGFKPRTTDLFVYASDI